MDIQLIDDRLAELKSNESAGQAQLQALQDEFNERKRQLQATLLRISGAIQVLEELRAEVAGEPRP
jgi:chromosome segregation ATPase